MESKLYVEVRLRDSHGKVHAVISEEVSPDVGYRGPRTADNFRTPVSFAGMTDPMKHAVEVLQVRELRRGLFRDMLPRMAERLADFLYDREGWSDPSRQEAVERIVRENRDF